jgi:hypothetical protein
MIQKHRIHSTLIIYYSNFVVCSCCLLLGYSLYLALCFLPKWFNVEINDGVSNTWFWMPKSLFLLPNFFAKKVKLKVSKKCYNEMIFENLNWDTFEKFGKNPSDSSTWFKEIAKKYRTYFVCSQIWLYLSIDDCHFGYMTKPWKKKHLCPILIP